MMNCPNCEKEVEVVEKYNDQDLFESWNCKECGTMISSNYYDNPNKDEDL